MAQAQTARKDLSAPRPWRAEPSDPQRPGAEWRVVASPRHGKRPLVVASFLSEEDARAIAGAPTLSELRRELAAISAAMERLELALSAAPADGWLEAYRQYSGAREAYERVLSRVSEARLSEVCAPEGAESVPF